MNDRSKVSMIATSSCPTGATRRLHQIGFVVVIGTSMLFGSMGCGNSTDTGTAEPTASESPAAEGFQRNPPLQVGSVTVPDVTLDDKGTPTSNGSFAMKAAPGRFIVMYFGYTTCPDVCPTTLAALKAAYKVLGDDARRIDTAMLTVDPERDTPEVLSGYLRSFVPQNAHALRTLEVAQLDAAKATFAAKSSVTKKPDGQVEVTHSGALYLIDSTGTVRLEWPFGVDAQGIADGIRANLASA